MTRKHNAPHRRSASNYKLRLQKRGLNRTPTMTPYNPDILDAIHKREAKQGKRNEGDEDFAIAS